MSDHLSSEQRVALQYREANDCSLVMLPNMPFWNRKAKSPEEKAEIKDRAQTLQAGIRMGYDEKVAHAEKVIRIALGLDAQGQPLEGDHPSAGVKWALSYSGGKDSTVLSHLMVFGMGIKLPHVMSNTRMEYPETLKQVTKWYAMLREWGVECHTAYPDAKPKDLWKKIGVPLWSKQMGKKFGDYSRSKTDTFSNSVPDNLITAFKTLKDAGMAVTDKCCSELKKKPLAKWDKVHKIGGHFTGVRCSESRARRLSWIQVGALYNSISHRQWIANPLAFWTQEDVERYLDDNGIRPIRIPTVRGGSGCVTCMFGCHIAAREGRPNALQELATLNPKMHAAALDDWGYRPVLDLLGIPYLPQDSETFPLLPRQRYNNTDTVMSLEQALAENTAALKELTTILKAAGTPANVTPITAAAKPEAEAPAPGEIELPDKIERKVPAKKAAKEAPAAADDTPSVPAKTAEPGGPAAAEHVDEDEVIAEIMQVVKAKITEATAIGEGDGVKDAWTAIRKKFGVERISELKGRPGDLLKALKAAQGL